MKDLSAYAELRHINLRKEGPDDDKTTAFDLKLEAMVPAEFVENLMLGDGEENGSVMAAFWADDGEPKFLSLEKVAIDRQVHNVSAMVEGIELRACKVKGFSFKPRGNRMAELTFTCSSNDFPSNATSVLAELLQEQVGVSLVAPQGDLFADGDPKAAASKLDEMAREDGGATLESGGEVLATFGEGPDPLYDQARAIVIETGKASVSTVQRRLKIGYNRAARLLEAMEAAGAVSPMQPSGMRDVLVTA